MNKIKGIAEKAKADGYVYMASVVKSVYNTTYYNVNRIDDIITCGKWIPAAYNNWPWHGRLGQSRLPDKCIRKDRAYRIYDPKAD